MLFLCSIRTYVPSIRPHAAMRADTMSSLSAVTGGIAIFFDHRTPRLISTVSVEVLLSWMGVQKEGAEPSEMAAKLVQYTDSSEIDSVQSEENEKSHNYFGTGCLSKRFEYKALTTAVLQEHMP